VSSHKRAGGRHSAISWLNRQLSARPPFHDAEGRKGLWTRFTRAPVHKVVTYRLHRSGVTRPWRIAVLADLHLGSHADDVNRLRGIVADTNDLDPDLVLLLGDYVNMMPFGGGRVPPQTIAGVLRGLSASAGVFGVLGNHDWRYGAEAVRRAFAAEGLRLIDNRIAVVEREGHRLALLGLDDDSEGEPDLSLFAKLPADVASVVVTHDPGLLHDIPAGHLVVCGHMHAGQIRWPNRTPPVIPSGRAPRRWAHGHVRENGCELIVSAGLGCSGFPLRIGSPPEIVVLELTGP
jgi:predicted MPP superfamily phosphohydrolase